MLLPAWKINAPLATVVRTAKSPLRLRIPNLTIKTVVAKAVFAKVRLLQAPSSFLWLTWPSVGSFQFISNYQAKNAR